MKSRRRGVFAAPLFFSRFLQIVLWRGKKNTIGYESEEAKRVSIKSLRTLDVYAESRLSLFFAKYSTAFMEVIFCGGQETH